MTDTGAEVDPLVIEQLRREQASKLDRRAVAVNSVRQVLTFSVFVVLLALLYTGYKAWGGLFDHEQDDWPVIGSYLPRSDDLNMPPVTDILGAFGEGVRGSDSNLATALFSEGLFTLREAAVGFVFGVIFGLILAFILAHVNFLEKGLTPYVVASQTVPLIAIAPLVVIYGRTFNFPLIDMPFEWQDWMSVSIIATYLTFFPVAINGLRGFKSPRPENLELMASYAAGTWATFRQLRLPASVPYLFASFKLAATSSVVGAIVGEISAGVEGGLGRRILSEALNYTTGPGRLYASVIGAALLGIAVFILITGLEQVILRSQGRKAVT